MIKRQMSKAHLWTLVLLGLKYPNSTPITGWVGLVPRVKPILMSPATSQDLQSSNFRNFELISYTAKLLLHPKSPFSLSKTPGKFPFPPFSTAKVYKVVQVALQKKAQMVR